MKHEWDKLRDWVPREEERMDDMLRKQQVEGLASYLLTAMKKEQIRDRYVHDRILNNLENVVPTW